MRAVFRWIQVLGIILALQSRAAGQSAAPPTAPPAWPVSSAPARFLVGVGDGKEKPAPLSSVKLYLPDPKWASMPIRVFDDRGQAVGSDVLWTAPGEPTTLLYDSSSGSLQYDIYVGSNWPPLHLPDHRFGVLLESRAGDGKPVNSLPEMLQAWNQSTTINGLEQIQGIYEGGSRFGPQANTLECFKGWFEAAAPEHLGLSIISDDATFVLVDGKEVLEWPGEHHFYDGYKGLHVGAVDLAAGIHLLECYNAYIWRSKDMPLLCCLAAQVDPNEGWKMLNDDSGFFRPLSLAHTWAYELQANSPVDSAEGGVPPLAFVWRVESQSYIDGAVPDIGLIKLGLMCLPLVKGTLTWTFGDGSTAQGATVNHLFLRAGMRTVQLSLSDGGKTVAHVSLPINVHFDWKKVIGGPSFLPADRIELMHQDPAAVSVSDLASCYAMFEAYGDSEGLLKYLPAICGEMKDMNEADLAYVKDAALLLAGQDWIHADAAMQLLNALVERSVQAPASAPMAALGSQARLVLARLVLKTSNRTDEVRSLLGAIDESQLPGDEKRTLKILRADLALATGDVTGARRQYENLTRAPSGPDVRSSIRRTAEISQARVFMGRKDFEAAEKSLHEVVWNAPVEKLSPDWALTRLRLDQEEGRPQVAYLWATRLLPVITGGDRSDLLFRLTGLALAQGDAGLGGKTLSELLAKYPYSQEAAEAKEKWPGQK